jgi:hypothetical protein
MRSYLIRWFSFNTFLKTRQVDKDDDDDDDDDDNDNQTIE